MLFARISVKSTLPVIALAFSLQHVKNTWACCVLEDLRILSIFSGCQVMGRGSAFVNLEQWHGLISGIGAGIYKCVAKACCNPLCNSMYDKPAPIPEAKHFQCDECESTFSSSQSLSVHMFRAHGTKNMFRRYVGNETHCIVCMKMFWTRERVVNHVRYRSNVCKEYHLQFAPYFSQEQADQYDAVEAKSNRDLQHSGHRRHKAQKPCVQLHGPMLNVSLQDGAYSKHHPLGRGHQYFA